MGITISWITIGIFMDLPQVHGSLFWVPTFHGIYPKFIQFWGHPQFQKLLPNPTRAQPPDKGQRRHVERPGSKPSGLSPDLHSHSGMQQAYYCWWLMVNMWLIYVNVLLIMVNDDGYYMVNDIYIYIYLVGGKTNPLKNDGVRQLGWWHSQYMEK